MHRFHVKFSVEGLLTGDRYMREAHVFADNGTDARRKILKEHPTARKITVTRV